MDGTSKLCCDCQQIKDSHLFHIYKRTGKPRPFCKECHNKRARAYALANPERIRQHQRKSNKIHSERRRKESAEWRRTHLEQARQFTREWTRKNKAHIAERERLRRARNLGVCPKCVAVMRATPAWLTEEHKQQIIQFYVNCPSNMQVDHIEPIRGVDRSGLHVPWNLQYLTPEENLKKGNR